MPTYCVVLAAAGMSSRFKDEHYKKPFANLKQKAVWLHSAERFLKRNDVKQLIVVISGLDRENFMTKFGANLAVMGIDVVMGGEERRDSVKNALDKVTSDIEFVAIHDAARPCVNDEDIEAVFGAAVQTEAAILATPITSTLKKATNQQISETVSRENLWQAMTPQVFKRQLLVDAYDAAGTKATTDDAQVVEMFGHAVTIVEGSPLNIKITTKRDLKLASACLDAMPQPKFDASPHPFADDNLWR